ncbi:propionyl-CoA carboxylase [candidate division KSB1 bacterium]|nr:propionyl-CoA carboxylase [candidate division KSB1 bacterium]MBL7095685.1 propionyl-CoA carboxylase [candidate division KSB1 bacterium]
MAKVLLERIGSPIESAVDLNDYRKNLQEMEKLNSSYISKREKIKAGWGERYVERVHKKGKMTTWERIEFLKDPESKIFPIGTFVNYGIDFFDGKSNRTSPAAGVITAFVKINGRYSVVIANDNTVASGSWWPLTPEKIERAQEIALKLRIPVVYLIDCSGLFLPEQSKTFPGKTGAGYIFKMNALLSANQVPQIAGVFGDCIAGGGYMPIISDVVYMTEQAYMVIAGAALVKGGKSQKITSLIIGGPDVHVHLSNCADHRVPDDETALLKIKDEIGKLPTPANDYYRYGQDAAPPFFDPAEIEGILPTDYRVTYDMKQVFARILDNSLFWELFPNKGKEIICGVGRINGNYVGLIANNQNLTDHPVHKNMKRPGGILYREGIAKMTSFARACNDDGLPLIWLQDVAGFDIGPEAEKMGLLGYGSDLLYTISNNTNPVITVLLRKASGAGYYAMNGRPYEPIIQLSTPLTRLAVMEGRTLAIGAYRTKLDENFNIISTTQEEYDAVKKGMEDVEQRITKDMDPILSARQLDTDEIILLHELRPYLEAMVEMCYQSIGYRRVKNPRIWAMHDIKALF